MNNELIRIPNCMATVLKMDEEGHMWFECKTSLFYLKDHEQSFPVKLHFYRKGFNYFADVSGCASILNWPDTGNSKKHKVILFKLNVTNIEYVEPQTKMKRFNNWIKRIYNLVLNHIVVPRNQNLFKPNQT